jgi:hypothetical protein
LIVNQTGVASSAIHTGRRLAPGLRACWRAGSTVGEIQLQPGQFAKLFIDVLSE